MENTRMRLVDCETIYQCIISVSFDAHKYAYVSIIRLHRMS